MQGVSHTNIRLPMSELMDRDRIIVEKICKNDDFAYYFFHEKCRPLLSKILWKIYGNNTDYDELVNELYLYLKKPSKDGDFWHGLKSFDYRTSLFDWIKTVAVRHFYTSKNEVIVIPEGLRETGLAEEMFSNLHKAVYRKFMCFKYLERLDDDAIATKLDVERPKLTALSSKAVRAFKSIVKNQYPEYYTSIFEKSEIIEVDIDSQFTPPSNNDEQLKHESHLDVYQYLDAMPNKYYRKVIKSLFIDDKAPEILAEEMGTPVSNIYNIKSRGLDQLRDIALFSNEICNLDYFIELVSNDRHRHILTSIFIDKKDYDVVCSELKITEVQFKKIKKDAIKEIKKKIFKNKAKLDHEDK